MATGKGKRKTTFYIREDLHDKIDSHGARRGLGKSDVVNLALERYFDWITSCELRGFDLNGDIIKPAGEWWPKEGQPPTTGPGRGS